MKYPTLLMILDGLGDECLQELGNRTPLQAAQTPAFDLLAKMGQCGLIDPLSNGKPANTTEGILGLLGYDPLVNPVGRGVIEALGAGIALQKGDIALRGNLACLDQSNRVRDRRAGRIREGACELLRTLAQIQVSPEVEFLIGAGTEHRFALVMRGEGLCEQISASDPGDGNPHGFRIPPATLNSADAFAKKTAEILDQFERQAHRILSKHPINLKRIRQALLPANAILTRDPGKLVHLPPLSLRNQPLQGMCIGGDKVMLGLAKLLRMEYHRTEQMTGNLDTDLSIKFEKARKCLNHYDLVVVHIKGCDIAAHDRHARKKLEFIEKIDQALAIFLQELFTKTGYLPIRVGITADHCTSSKKGYHINDPVPVIIYRPEQPADLVEAFDEIQSTRGMLGRFRSDQLLEKLWFGTSAARP